MAKIYLKPGEEDRLLEGHLWVYSNENEKILEDGSDIADVFTSSNRFIGRGCYSAGNAICC
ncbi:MAG: hypothetical protein GX633_07305, partial [Clostridiales bacterium]|nr:hypothetical protein [Clostridiales bacterium]